jgi:prophage regulatory protein
MKLITFSELRAKLGGRARSTIYLDIEHQRLPSPLKLGGKLYWEEAQLNDWFNLQRAEADQ